MILLMIHQHGEMICSEGASCPQIWDPLSSIQVNKMEISSTLELFPESSSLSPLTIWTVSQYISSINCVSFNHFNHVPVFVLQFLGYPTAHPPLTKRAPWSWSRCQKRGPAVPAAPATPQALRCSSTRDKDGNSCRTCSDANWQGPRPGLGTWNVVESNGS